MLGDLLPDEDQMVGLTSVPLIVRGADLNARTDGGDKRRVIGLDVSGVEQLEGSEHIGTLNTALGTISLFSANRKFKNPNVTVFRETPQIRSFFDFPSSGGESESTGCVFASGKGSGYCEWACCDLTYEDLMRVCFRIETHNPYVSIMVDGVPYKQWNAHDHYMTDDITVMCNPVGVGGMIEDAYPDRSSITGTPRGDMVPRLFTAGKEIWLHICDVESESEIKELIAELKDVAFRSIRIFKLFNGPTMVRVILRLGLGALVLYLDPESSVNMLATVLKESINPLITLTYSGKPVGDYTIAQWISNGQSKVGISVPGLGGGRKKNLVMANGGMNFNNNPNQVLRNAQNQQAGLAGGGGGMNMIGLTPKQMRRRARKREARMMQRNAMQQNPVGSILGAVAGGMTEIPGMAQMGALVGGALGSRLNRIYGSGDYTFGAMPEVNSLMALNANFTGGGRDSNHARFSKREFLTDIRTGDAGVFNLFEVEMNPTLASFSEALSIVSLSYEKYRFRGIVFQFISTTGNTAVAGGLGSIVATAQYNLKSGKFGSKNQMEDTENAISTRMDTNWMYGVECKDTVNMLSLVLSDEEGGQTDAALGRFAVGTVSTPATENQVIGELWVAYDVEFVGQRHSPVKYGYLRLSTYGNFTNVVSSVKRGCFVTISLNDSEPANLSLKDAVDEDIYMVNICVQGEFALSPTFSVLYENFELIKYHTDNEGLIHPYFVAVQESSNSKINYTAVVKVVRPFPSLIPTINPTLLVLGTVRSIDTVLIGMQAGGLASDF